MLKVKNKLLLVVGHDVAATFLAWVLAYWLRFNFAISEPYMQSMWNTLVWVVPLQTFIFWRFGLYRGVWRFASLPDLKRIIMAVGVAGLSVPVVLYMVHVPVAVPRSVLVLDPLLLVMVVGGSRFVYRSWKEHHLYRFADAERQPVLVLGAGEIAAGLVKELSRSKEWRVEGLLDDDPAMVGRLIQGVKVLGRVDELPKWAGRYDVHVAIIAMPSASHQARRRAVKLCSSANVKSMTVPAFDDLASGRVTVSQIRQVELDDLLGRDPVTLDEEGLHGLLTGQPVMVTGAGGSIGSELCRQIARFEPACLVLFELNEFVLYRMEQEFAEKLPQLRIVCAIGDVKDEARLDQVMCQYAPAAIFHAAAYKHVPLMEQENAWQAVLNNVLGTCTVARAAMRHGVKKFVLISTDKAVNPTNVMGATKRLAEMVCQGLQQEGGTRFVMVRFGNVLGSTGSVIPKFQEQIVHGGPITVTHPEITRYFMSIPEAAQLVLQAGLMGEGGEIFVLDMGEPVRIVELAKDMIRLSGFSEGDIPIVFTGLRPGEKLYEELLADDEHTLPTPHPKLRIAQARTADGVWLDALLQWTGSGEMLSEQEVKQGLKKWVPEYCSSKNS
ncbi:polysaccharide biosynthesis protein CapD [Sulfuricella denitrificans skB26]|uniref:Polysaccharide biosynthesis protein CapD n=1 Tax=Sulfuricella denitrificans (strain DSM 22764 / NBRC 105220 / skB26) TaxID=1163617 RepID=S6B8I3_SULDS|nr:nucleoside-diphosphate sugar epimerase/dehydratase [Sulfuricella denitrificans]BAN36672.1 polysaccharide biosynthesis protein CapD [Sulfuricella denitrificans skB26]